MGNGAKAAQKRERNATQGGKNAGKSSLKANEAAKSIICMVCRQTFLVTTRAPALITHSENRHSGMAPKECFPDFAFP